MPKFEKVLPDLKYGRTNEEHAIMHGNKTYCFICKAETPFWYEFENVGLCSTECRDEHEKREKEDFDARGK